MERWRYKQPAPTGQAVKVGKYEGPEEGLAPLKVGAWV